MNAAETIAAAIEKLEKLKAESTQPTDGTSWIQGNDRKPYETSGEIYTGPLSETSGDIASWIVPADAALIVTLHRTIDAQLAILRTVFDARLIEHSWGSLVYTENAVVLARAILGESS